MNRFRYEAFMQEFPFLHQIMVFKDGQLRGPHWVDRITVHRADENFLAMIPSSGSWNGSLGESYHWTKVHVIMADGRIIKDCVRQKEKHGSNYAHSQTEYIEGESILEALGNLEDPDKVQYIVIEFRDFSDWSGQERIDIYEVDIYKPPKSVTYSDLIAKARKRALEQVKAEANF